MRVEVFYFRPRAQEHEACQKAIEYCIFWRYVYAAERPTLPKNYPVGEFSEIKNKLSCSEILNTITDMYSYNIYYTGLPKTSLFTSNTFTDYYRLMLRWKATKINMKEMLVKNY